MVNVEWTLLMDITYYKNNSNECQQCVYAILNCHGLCKLGPDPFDAAVTRQKPRQ